MLQVACSVSHAAISRVSAFCSAVDMAHRDFNSVFSVIRVVMAALPHSLSSILEPSLSVVLAIFEHVETAKQHKEDLMGLYEHAAAVQAQVILSLRNRPGDEVHHLGIDVHTFVGVIQLARDFVAETTGIKPPGIFTRIVRIICPCLTASTTDEITNMQCRISRAAVAFGISADVHTEHRIQEVHQVCGNIRVEQEKQAQLQRKAAETDKRDLRRAKERIPRRLQEDPDGDGDTDQDENDQGEDEDVDQEQREANGLRARKRWRTTINTVRAAKRFNERGTVTAARIGRELRDAEERHAAALLARKRWKMSVNTVRAAGRFSEHGATATARAEQKRAEAEESASLARKRWKTSITTVRAAGRFSEHGAAAAQTKQQRSQKEEGVQLDLKRGEEARALHAAGQLARRRWKTGIAAARVAAKLNLLIAESGRAERERQEVDERVQQEFKRAEEARERYAQQQREANIASKEQADAREREQLHELLKPVHSATHYSAAAPQPCAEGTRVNILAAILKWATSGTGPLAYWLAGMAGTGKSTIASSVCRQLEASGFKVLSFFISHHAPERCTMRAMISTLAYQLAQCDPQAQSKIIHALQSQPPILSRSIANQTQALLVDPINAIWAGNETALPDIALVIDAMDECEELRGPDGLSLLATLLQALNHGGRNVKLFMTSRYEVDLRVMLDRAFAGAQDARETFMLHNVEATVVSADIRVFVTTGFAAIRSQFPSIPSSWPPQEQIDELVTLSGKLFVYASTVLLWIGDRRASPITRLSDILYMARASRLTGPHDQSPYSYLDRLHLAVLQRMAFNPDPASDINVRLRLLLLLVTFGDYDVCAEILSGVLMLEPHDLEPLLASLSSVLVLPSTSAGLFINAEELDTGMMQIPQDWQIRVFHESFSDFIVDPRRCTDQRFLTSRDSDEPRLALAMLQVVNRLPGPSASSGTVPVLVAHVRLHWYLHLFNTLNNRALECGQVLAHIQNMQNNEVLATFSTPRLSAKHFRRIQLQLAALVDTLPKQTATAFRQDVIALAEATSVNARGTEQLLLVVHAVTALVIHARVPQTPDTKVGFGLGLPEPERIEREEETSFHSDLRRLPSVILKGDMKDIEEYRSSLLSSARSCTEDAIPDGELLLSLKLLEICLHARIRYAADSFAPWLEFLNAEEV
ncbi:hypothetical protein BKA62DRAFT_645049 [Auriculariales sp. MPI-PUGE-AT-0066]|nr:hypothetical protein BKA62DRAFT_645049 [Auriculariales sp. MPI-PUGE-AT-0066]